MDSPPSLERRTIRYSLNLPVSLTLAHKKFQARSESISLGGILLSSAFFIPEGSAVEVEVRVAQLPQPGTFLSARGKVLHVQPKAAGDFSVAVAFDRPIEFGLEGLESGTHQHIRAQRIKDQHIKDQDIKDQDIKDQRIPGQQLKDLQLKDLHLKDQQLTKQQIERPRLPARENKLVPGRGPRLGSAWIMET